MPALLKTRAGAGLMCLLAVIVVTLIVIVSLVTSGQDCDSLVGSEAQPLLSTKRPYYFNSDLAQGQTYTPEGCLAEKFWYFGRHGTRYPGDDDIEAMQKILPGLHEEIMEAREASTICTPALEYFSTWKLRPDLNVSTESYLTRQGAYELSSISWRYRLRYPHLFPGRFSNDSYYFKFTKSERTEASARAFASSIFGKNRLDTVWFPKPLPVDPILKFYKACPKWEQLVDEHPAGNMEQEKFLVGPEMNNTIVRVSQRLGLTRILTLDELITMYTTCSFETAWNNGTISQWCVAFDKEDLAVMEYSEDLHYFWTDGYGYDINWLQACPPFKDAIEFFDNSPRSVQAYFSHSGSTLKMFARLGLFKGGNDKITASNFQEMRHTYEWRTGKIDFMGTNMAFVTFTCKKEPKRRVGLFTQELATPFPACGGHAFCAYEDFRSKMSEFTDNCNLQEICRV